MIASLPCLHVIEPGLGLQLRGRKLRGVRHQGMPQGGALDTYTLAIGNLLLGNARDADALELLGGRLRLQVDSPLTVAMTGCGFMTTLIRDGRYLSLAAQTRHRVQQGDELIIQQGANPGVAYLCIAGGVNGGNPGAIEQTLTQGSKLRCAEPQELERASQPRAQFGAKIEMLQVEELAIRATRGSDDAALPAQAVEEFWSRQWQLTENRSRMGAYLQPLAETPSRADGSSSGKEAASATPLTLASHCVLPGTIQLPDKDSPVLLLTDCQTTGGYPKIAKVIQADMWKLLQAGPRATIKFVETDIHEATQALLKQEQSLYRLELAISRVLG